MTTFRAYGPDVYMGTARLNADAVRGLLEIFNRERSWQAMDELNAAAADAGVVIELETVDA
jgi:hypothetical protein